MASTSKQHPSIHRINNAYVQVPVSPLSLVSYRPLKTPIYSAKLKENTPLRPLQSTTNLSISCKRKLSDCDSIHDAISIVKKARPSKVKAERSQPIAPASACPNSPNEYVRCHQCSKKRDILTTIRCNIVKRQQIKGKGTVERPCTNNYCKGCLKKKYSEDLDLLQGRTTVGVAAFFTCPRCRGLCNCTKCKKLSGVEVTSLSGPHPNALVVSGTAKSEKKLQATRTKVENVAERPVLPQIKWISIPYTITRIQAEERIFIREFALRFGHIMAPTMAKSSIEELELIAGKTNNNDHDEMPAWVSEPCLKGLVLGLLGLLAKDHDAEVAQEIRAAIKDIRSAGALRKIWSNLVVLRHNVANLFSSSISDAQPSAWVPLTFPDPLPAPASLIQRVRSLRNIRSVGPSENIVNIVHTTQMIPVVTSLIHSVLETASVREEIDQGVRDEKEIVRNAREAVMIEKERWDQERRNMEATSKNIVDKNEENVKRKARKDRLLDINNVVKLTTHGFTSRFSILGTDGEGRTYYALSPGVLEREAAFEYLEVISTDKRKLKKKGRSLTAEGRSGMKEWSWFVSVWGKKPLSDEKEDDDGNEAEKWWGFWEPEEIVKVADWISIKSKLEDQETPEDGTSSQSQKDSVKVQLKQLVTQLKDYAALLEWRLRDNKFSISDTPSSDQN